MRPLARPALLALALASLAAVPAVAADVWVVDDSGGPGVHFTSLAAAAAAAADGDVLLLRSGSYAGDVALDGKSLVVAADAGATVSLTGALTVANLAPAQRVVLAGFASSGTLAIEACAGPVWVQDVVLATHPLAQVPEVVRVEDSDAVLLVRTAISGGSFFIATNPALRASASSVALYDCELVGGSGYGGLGGPFPGGPGVELAGALLHAAGGTVAGGSGTPVGSLFGCEGTSGGGGPGIRFVGAPSTAVLRGTALAGGLPGALQGSGSCTAGPPGPVTQGAGVLDLLPWPPRHLAVSTPVVAGAAVSVALAGAPGDLVWLAFAPHTAVLPIDGIAGPLAVGAPFAVGALGVLGPSGALAFAAPTFVPPGTEAVVYFAQALFVGPQGDATLGDPAHVLELAPPF